MIRILKQVAQQIGEMLNGEASAPSDSPAEQDVSSSNPEAGRVSASDKVAGQPRLIGLVGACSGQVIPLVGNSLVIGRSASFCDLAVPTDPLLSPHHVVLSLQNNAWYCADLDSSTGSYLDSVRVRQTAMLVAPGSILRCGGQQFRVAYGSYVARDNAPDQPATTPAPVKPPATKAPAPTAAPAPSEGMRRWGEIFAGVFQITPHEEREPKPKSVKSPARWVAAGELVTVQGIILPDGMFYLGSKLNALNGYNIEPSLIDPKAQIAPSEADDTTDTRYNYYLSYSTIEPAVRRRYLEWLSSGRRASDIDAAFLFLFFYGLERRLVAGLIGGKRKVEPADAPIKPEEERALRAEITRLMACYDHASFQAHARELLEFLELKDLLSGKDPLALPDPGRIAAMPKRYQDIPPVLAVSLGRIAVAKQPLPAEWAWAWFIHDPESVLRTAAVRCPDEMHRLFLPRFTAAAERKRVNLHLTKLAIRADYEFASQSCYATASLNPKTRAGEPMRQVSRTPLKGIRETASACMDALDAYSRRVGRDPDSRNSLPVVALLPDPLFGEHPAISRFRDYLDGLVREEADALATVPVAALLTEWRRPDPASSAHGAANVEGALDSAVVALSRADTVVLLETVTRLGFVLEPDLRFGGPALSVGKSGDGVAALALRHGSDPQNANDLTLAVALPLLVRAARASGDTSAALLRPLALRLPRAATCNPARILARLAWLTAHPAESAKLPRRAEPALVAATDDEKAEIADVLVHAASLTGVTGPPIVVELIRLFALLGLPDSEVFTRLHVSAATSPLLAGVARRGSATASRSGGRNAPAEPDEPMAVIQTGQPGAEYAIPKVSNVTGPGAKRARGRVTIDHALVKQKEAESAEISLLLSEIFSDDDAVGNGDGSAGTMSGPVDAGTATAPPLVAPPAPGGLDVRHAALLRALVAKDSWTGAEVAALARAENLLPHAAVDTLNEAAYERVGEPVLDGEDPVYVLKEIAQEMLS